MGRARSDRGRGSSGRGRGAAGQQGFGAGSKQMIVGGKVGGGTVHRQDVSRGGQGRGRGTSSNVGIEGRGLSPAEKQKKEKIVQRIHENYHLKKARELYDKKLEDSQVN